MIYSKTLRTNINTSCLSQLAHCSPYVHYGTKEDVGVGEAEKTGAFSQEGAGQATKAGQSLPVLCQLWGCHSLCCLSLFRLLSLCRDLNDITVMKHIVVAEFDYFSVQ